MIIVDHRIPTEVKRRLNKMGKLVEFETTGITYDAISGHPDIFFCQMDNELVVAPNLPEHMIHHLNTNGVAFKVGQQPVNETYPNSAIYNAVCTQSHIIHNLKITDPVILKTADRKNLIHIKQGYSRCNLLPLNSNRFITSDMGIQKSLVNAGLTSIQINPKEILLPGFSHGFFGGACGIFQNTVYIIGKLDYLEEGDDLRDFIHSSGYDIVELYDGPLFDGGSIIFLDS